MALKNTANRPDEGIVADEKELDAAIAAAEGSASVFTCKLRKPVLYNGTTYDSFSFDFEKITGLDCIKIERELSAQGIAVAFRAVSAEFLIRFCAKACTIPNVGFDMFYSMSSKDYDKITNAARGFLLRAE